MKSKMVMSSVLFATLFNLSIEAKTVKFDRELYVSNSSKEHDVKLLNHGMGALEERLRLIERAKESIDVEYFIYNADISGKIFTQALIKKAKEGVRVRVLLDYFMIKDQINTYMIEELKKVGVEVKYYNPAPLIRFIKAQYRNHRKVLIIDKKIAITGGRNIGNEYFDLSPEFNFVDRDMLIEGEIVDVLDKSFDSVYNSKDAKFKKRPDIPSRSDAKYGDYSYPKGINEFEYKNDLKRFAKKVTAAKEFLFEEAEGYQVDKIRNLGSKALESEYVGKCNSIDYISEYPIASPKVKKQRNIKHDVYSRIKNAKDSVLLDSPYFIVDGESSEAMKTALANGVNIELLTNGLHSTDAIYVYAVFETIVKDWIKLGLKPYMYLGHKPESYISLDDTITAKTRFGVHAKTMIYDNKDVTIGTFNFDPRSYNFNTEMVVTCNNNPELAAAVKSDIMERMNSAVLLDSTEKVKDYEFYEVDGVKKIVYYLLKIPSNLFDHLL